MQFEAFVVNPGRGDLGVQLPSRPECVFTDTDGTAEKLTGKSVPCTVERFDSHILDCRAAEQSRIALACREAKSHHRSVRPTVDEFQSSVQ